MAKIFICATCGKQSKYKLPFSLTLQDGSEILFCCFECLQKYIDTHHEPFTQDTAPKNVGIMDAEVFGKNTKILLD